MGSNSSNYNKSNKNGNKILSGIATLVTAAPIIEQVTDKIITVIDDTMEKHRRLVSVPELYSKEYPLSVEQAVQILTDRGLQPILVEMPLSDVNIKYRYCFCSQVISTKPRAKSKVEPGSHVYVKYITQELIDSSQKLFEDLEEQKAERKIQKELKQLERKEISTQKKKNVQNIIFHQKKDDKEQES